MSIIPSAANCSVASCPVDLGPACPAPLVGPLDSTGFPVGCKSACVANLGGNPGAFVRSVCGFCLITLPAANSSNCCTGSFNTAATCPSSGVDFYSYFSARRPPRAKLNRTLMIVEGNCPNSYAYAFDESSGTALWTCSSILNSNYTLTFCPCGPIHCIHLSVLMKPHRPPAGSPAPAPISAVPSSLIPTETVASALGTFASRCIAVLFSLCYWQLRVRAPAVQLRPALPVRALVQTLRDILVRMLLGHRGPSFSCRVVSWQDGSWYTNLSPCHTCSSYCKLLSRFRCCVGIYFLRKDDIRNDKAMIAREHPIVSRVTIYKHVLRLPNISVTPRKSRSRTTTRTTRRHSAQTQNRCTPRPSYAS